MASSAPRFRGLDPADAGDSALLEATQAGILKGHGRRHYAVILVRALATADSSKAVHFGRLQSGRDQYYRAREFKGKGIRDALFSAAWISASGCKRLNVPAAAVPSDAAFRNGMKSASVRLLKDPHPRTWEPFYRGDIDFCFSVAADTLQTLEQARSRVIESVEAVFGDRFEMHIETGEALRNEAGRPTDVFGFVDGISQPLFLKYDIDAYLDQHPDPEWDPSFDPRELVLVPDRLVPDGMGSYVAFRKLEQSRVSFENSVAAVATAAGISSHEAEAQIFGRFRDGTALALRAGPAPSQPEENDFDYGTEPKGQRCPLHAHVRKANPRVVNLDFEYRRIGRRGVPFSYGGASGGASEGLLFVCVQQDLSRQFEFQQSRWMNEPRFPPEGGKVGTDPVSSSVPNPPQIPQKWNAAWNTGAVRLHSVDSFARMLGGEYFYAPPPTWFEALGATSRA